MRNEDTTRELKLKSIVKSVEKNKLGWYGHLIRMDLEEYSAKFYCRNTRDKKVSDKTHEEMT